MSSAIETLEARLGVSWSAIRGAREIARSARNIGHRIRRIVAKEAARTGTFGGIVASHELVHYIAGTRDTNENLTRRILLLSESRALTTPSIRSRVIQNVLLRYVFMTARF